MAFFGKDKQKVGVSSGEHNRLREYLHRVHGIEKRLFDNVHNTLVVIDSIGVEDAHEEVDALRRYADKLAQLSEAERKHLVKDPKKLYKLETEQLSLEHNLVSLLKKVRASLDDSSVEQLIESVDGLLEKLRIVVSQEEELLGS